MIEKIISGGQTGADRAGLDAAALLKIPTGGTAPKGFRICNYDGTDGSDPSLANLGLVEHPLSSYPPRTKQNVLDSHGTVWFGFSKSPGGVLTIKTCKTEGKPVLILETPFTKDLEKRFINWIQNNNIKILNVAGNRHSKFNPDIYQCVFDFLISVFSNYEGRL